MDYMIAEAPNPKQLVEQVRILISGGWQPQGGMAVTHVVPDAAWSVQYLQAMVFVFPTLPG